MMKKAKLPVPLERDVSQAIADYFALVYHIELHRRNTGAVRANYKGKTRFIRFSVAGQADRWGIAPNTGRHIEIEVKRQGKFPSDEQRAWLDACRAQGAIAFWADSVHMAIEKYREQV